MVKVYDRGNQRRWTLMCEREMELDCLILHTHVSVQLPNHTRTYAVQMISHKNYYFCKSKLLLISFTKLLLKTTIII